MMRRACVVFALVFLPVLTNAYLRTSRMFVYCSYSFSLGSKSVKMLAAGLKFARTTQDELADSNGNRAFGSARIGLETGLMLDKYDTLFFRIPYDFFNYGRRNGTGGQQTFSLGFAPGYAFSGKEGVFFITLSTAMETTALLTEKVMRRIGLSYHWVFADRWKTENGKRIRSLAGILDGFYADFGLYFRFGDFSERIVNSDSFNIGFID